MVENKWIHRTPNLDVFSSSGWGCLSLLSGGLDSAVATGISLKSLKQKTDTPEDLVIGVFFDYGQRSLEAEIAAVKYLARFFNIAVLRVNIDLNFWPGSDNALTAGGDVTDQKKTFVPARNIIFLSYMASLVEQTSARAVITGLAGGSEAIYPDTTSEFSLAMGNTIRQGLGRKDFDMVNPLIRVSDKVFIVEKARELGIHIPNTVSCYDAKVIRHGGLTLIDPCGKCSPCQVRQRCREATMIPIKYIDMRYFK